MHIYPIYTWDPSTSRKNLLINAIDELNSIDPDVTIITGDITENGYFLEFQEGSTIPG